MNDPIDITCKTIDDIEKDRLHCPTCKRDYAVMSHTHECSIYIQCTLRDTVSYSEKYYAKRGRDVMSTKCSACTQAAAAEHRARKGVCPVCKYEGRYVFTDDKRCPPCRLQTAAPILSVSTITEVIPDATQVQVYTSMTLQGNGFDTQQLPLSILIIGVTEKSILSGKWAVTSWLSGELSTDDNLLESMKSLSDWMAECKKQNLSLQWKFADDSVEKLWLMYLYEHYIATDKTPLNFSY